jgi:hypothetical protein
VIVDGDIVCDEPRCKASIRNHRWGKTKAGDWFFARGNDDAYCPKHVPAWVQAWREKKKKEAT